MAKASLAASVAARNKYVLKFVNALQRFLRSLPDQTNTCAKVADRLPALRTLIDLAHKAIAENGVAADIKAYHKNLRVYVYYCSIFEKKQCHKLKITFADIYENMAYSLADMVMIARDSFAKLDYPPYYQEFEHALDVLLKRNGLARQILRCC